MDRLKLIRMKLVVYKLTNLQFNFGPTIDDRLRRNLVHGITFMAQTLKINCNMVWPKPEPVSPMKIGFEYKPQNISYQVRIIFFKRNFILEFINKIHKIFIFPNYRLQ